MGLSLHLSKLLELITACVFFFPLQNGDLLSAKPLIAFGADINRFNSSNQTPLDLAWHQSRELADLLAGIGGMDGITIMANLQINGSQQSRENYHQDDVTNITEETVDGGSLEEEKSFERLLNPDVMRINPAQQGPSIDGLAGGGDGSGDGEREEAPDNEALEGDKMPSIPEGLSMWCSRLVIPILHDKIQ